MKQIPLLIFLINLVGTINAQTIEWKSIARETSSGDRITYNSDNQILQARWGSSSHPNSIAKYSEDGELIWERTVCDCYDDRVLISQSIFYDSILHITWEGEMYISDSDGQNLELIDQLYPDSDKIHWSSFPSINIDRSYIYMVVNGNDTLQQSSVLRLNVDLQTLEISKTLESSESYVWSSRYNPNNGLSVEIFQGIEGANKFIVYDNKFEPILTKEQILPNTEFLDGYVTDNNKVILIGVTNTENMRIGVVIAFNLEGEKLWETEIKLILGGNTGPGFWFGDALVLSLDEDDGTVNWRLREHIGGEGDEVADILILDNGDIIVSGTSGVTDYGGPQRAFLFKINDIGTNVSDLEDKDIKIYPNPSSGLITISAKTKIEQVDIISMGGRTIKSIAASNSISADDVLAGIYLLRVKTKNEFVVRKIIIQ